MATYDNVLPGLADVGEDERNVQEILDLLRQEGNDNARIEAKSAAGGVPENLSATISAFANTPGGGIIILGVDESMDFRLVDLPDATQTAQALAQKSRDAVVPAVRADIKVVSVNRQKVVLAHVAEADPSIKPVKVKRSGRAYVRTYDGDTEISSQEETAFKVNAGQPHFDRTAVPGTSVDDLDQRLLGLFLTEIRSQSARLASMPDDAVLAHKNVVTEPGGVLTLAGILALGQYPQRYHPSLIITAAAREGADSTVRATDVRYIDGPIPDMLDEAVRWVRRNSSSRVVFGRGGHGQDEPQYPEQAVRELVANALVHRDIGPHAQSQSIDLRIEQERLVVSNAGGLWGLTVDQLGRQAGGHARNNALYDICKYVRSTSGHRVVEAIGSGIVTVRNELTRAGMTPPSFFDSGLSFTAIVPGHAVIGMDDLVWIQDLPHNNQLNDRQRHAAVALRHGREWTNSSYREAFAIDSVLARKELQHLSEFGLADAVGEGRGRRYCGPAATVVPNDAADPLPVTSRTSHQPPRPKLEDIVFQQLAHGPATAKELVDRTGLQKRQVEGSLRSLRSKGIVLMQGGQGRRETRYRLI